MVFGSVSLEVHNFFIIDLRLYFVLNSFCEISKIILVPVKFLEHRPVDELPVNPTLLTVFLLFRKFPSSLSCYVVWIFSADEVTLVVFFVPRRNLVKTCLQVVRNPRMLPLGSSG